MASPLSSQTFEHRIAAECSSRLVAACRPQKAGYLTNGHRRSWRRSEILYPFSRKNQ